ncbi:hypothetical protein B0A52_06902 [Exophiala mesophila]|uniref:RRM domain-containing protein n=1 Tax=Exophiala mesophila TaxID=212818 RepID=A0A438N0Q3_EXOME|nr:hypothetical protein B0A52_06902 [Exophiala mesophila]
MSTAVDNLADNLKNASVTEASNANNEAVLASAAEGRRLYIGNLAYATTEAELKQFFSGYDVESTSIPVNPRTNRPVGYAFVDLKTSEEAEKAIANLSGQDILERKVSVQLARKPEQTATTEAAADGTDGDSKKTAGRGRGGRGRGRGGRARGGARATDGPVTDISENPLPLTDVTADANKATTETDAKARAPRPPKQRGPPEDGIPSTTKVMVANLPYDLSEEKASNSRSPPSSSAKIALRPIPRFMVKKLQARNEPRKGRGFGFVTLGSEELQQKAVNEMNGKQIEGREIAVKVAIDSPGKEDGAENIENGTNGTTEEVATA